MSYRETVGMSTAKRQRKQPDKGGKINMKGNGNNPVSERQQVTSDHLAALPPTELSFALAVAVIQEHIRTLPEDDRNDLKEVIPFLFCDDEEDVAAAQKAVNEIFHQRKATISPVSPIPDRDAALKEWLTYISNRISTVRKEAGLTQAELAVKAGLPQSHVSRLEQGRHSPTHKTLTAIANACGISLAELDPNEPRLT